MMAGQQRIEKWLPWPRGCLDCPVCGFSCRPVTRPEPAPPDVRSPRFALTPPRWVLYAADGRDFDALRAAGASHDPVHIRRQPEGSPRSGEFEITVGGEQINRQPAKTMAYGGHRCCCVSIRATELSRVAAGLPAQQQWRPLEFEHFLDFTDRLVVHCGSDDGGSDDSAMDRLLDDCCSMDRLAISDSAPVEHWPTAAAIVAAADSSEDEGEAPPPPGPPNQLQEALRR